MIRIRNTRPEDAPAVVDVQRRAFRDSPDMKLWAEEEIRAHVEVYPEGQFVAVDDERNDLVVGSATSMRVSSRVALAPHNWREVTGGGRLPNHDPAGDVLYGVDVSVRPTYRKRGVGRLLYDARLELLQRTDCVGFAAGGRIPNYHHFAKFMPPDEYVRLVQMKVIRDPVLNFQIGNEMEVRGLLPNYLTDASSMNYATLIFLPNPAQAAPTDGVVRQVPVDTSRRPAHPAPDAARPRAS